MTQQDILRACDEASQHCRADEIRAPLEAIRGIRPASDIPGLIRGMQAMLKGRHDHDREKTYAAFVTVYFALMATDPTQQQQRDYHLSQMRKFQGKLRERLG